LFGTIIVKLNIILNYSANNDSGMQMYNKDKTKNQPKKLVEMFIFIRIQMFLEKVNKSMSNQ
jgi:hypothetical protein